MTWREKLQTLRDLAVNDEYLRLVFSTTSSGAPDQFLDELRRSAPYLPDSYIEFLRMTDGAQLDLFVLPGSGSSVFPSLMKTNKTWRQDLGPTDMVIATDSAGSPFILRGGGQVFLMPSDPPDPEQATFVAWNFDDLLDQVFMGPRYYSLFPYGTSEGNEWVELLVQQKWAPPPAGAA